MWPPLVIQMYSPPFIDPLHRLDPVLFVTVYHTQKTLNPWIEGFSGKALFLARAERAQIVNVRECMHTGQIPVLGSDIILSSRFSGLVGPFFPTKPVWSSNSNI